MSGALPQLPASPMLGHSASSTSLSPAAAATGSSPRVAPDSPLVVRRSSHAPSPSMSDRPRRDIPRDYHSVPLDKLTAVEFDLEQCLRSSEVQREKLRALVEIPGDDLSVRVTPKEPPTLTPSHAEVDLQRVHAEESLVNQYQWIDDCIAFFRDDFVSVVRRTERLGKGDCYGRTDADALPRWEIDFAARHATSEGEAGAGEPDHLLLDHVQKEPRMAKWAAAHRQALFSLFAAPDFFLRNSAAAEAQQQQSSLAQQRQGQQHTTSESPQPLSAPFAMSFPSRQFVVELKDIAFEQPQFEPVFGTLAIYDLTKMTKMSEDFHFETNPARVSTHLHVHRSPIPCAFTSSRKAFFSISNPSTDMVLVLTISKVLQGDLDDVLEHYTKPAKDVTALERSAKEVCERLGLFRQVICWGIQPLFVDQSAENRCAVMAGDRTFAPLFRHASGDTPFLTALLDSFAREKGGMSKKLKTLPGRCTFTITEVTSTSAPLCGRVTPSLLPVKPFPEDTLDKHLVIRDIEEFPERRLVSPHLEYVNNLYVNLHSANLSKGSGRNIAVKIQLISAQGAEPMFVLFDNPSGEPLSKFCFSTVTYHSKTPSWQDEFKLKLPARISQSHHLLFTFYHVNCQLKKKEQALLSPVGYSILPLISNMNAIACGDFTLPVATELPPDYMTAADDKMKYMDGKKPLFRFSVRVVSTVYPTDKNLARFFQVQRSLTATTDDLSKAMQKLYRTEVGCLVQWLPVILRQLFRVMCRVPKLSAEAFATLIDVLSDMQDNLSPGHFNELLDQCIQYLYFNMSSRDSAAISEVFEEVTKNWLAALNGSSECDADAVNKFAGFLFSVIYKSMVVKLWEDKKLEPDVRAAGFHDDWFPQRHITNITRLLILLRSDTTRTPRMSRCVAAFMRDMLTILNRGRVLGMIKHFIENLPEFDMSALDCKYEVFRVICEYEHYIALNLPTKDPIAMLGIPDEEIDLGGGGNTITRSMAKQLAIATMAKRAKQHFIAELLLQNVDRCCAHVDRKVRMKALLTLRDVFIKHDLDERYTGMGKLMRKRVCSIYAGFLGTAVANVQTFLVSEDEDERRTFSACVLWILKNMGKHNLRTWFRRQFLHDLEGFCDVLKVVVRCFSKPYQYHQDSTPVESPSPSPAPRSQTVEEHGLSSASPPLGGSGSATTTTTAAAAAAQLPPVPLGGQQSPHRNPGSVRLSTDQTKALLEGYYQTSRSPRQRSFRSLREKKATVRTDVMTLFERKPSSAASLPWPHSYNDSIEKNMLTEAVVTVLDVLQQLQQEMATELQDTSSMPNGLLDQVVRVYTELLGLNQSRQFFQHLYLSLRVFASRFTRQIVELKTFYCGDFCRLAIRHANNRDEGIRSEAAAFLYLMLRHNYELTGRQHINRAKVQMTMGLSQLAGGEGIRTVEYLRRAFDSITRYCQLQYPAADTAPAEDATPPPTPSDGKASLMSLLDEMLKRLSSILSDSVKLNRFAKDPEMTADLYLRIAASYKNTPDLRFMWLNQLVAKHIETGNKTEAAVCVLHMAAFAAEFIAAMSRKPDATPEEKDAIRGLPSGSRAFLSVAPNADEEESMQIATHTDEDGCNQSELNEVGLLCLLNKAAGLLYEAELYELQNEVYKLIIPIHEKHRRYEDLRAAHITLATAFERIVEANIGGNRLLGSYYRVGLFGLPLEDLNGTEWIYREAKLTLLPEIKNRLIAQFQQSYGADVKINIVTDSGTADPALKDDPAGIHIQITKVEPYFSEQELLERPVYAERNFNIDRFIFETPFTSSGQRHSQSVADQWKRKTILTTQCKFPYTKKRLLVVGREELVMSPIEVSIEAIEARTERLRSALRNPDPKMLQPILQGSCAVTVNQGPIEICRSFLPILSASGQPQPKPAATDSEHSEDSLATSESADQQPPELVERLREGVKEFLKACSLGLKVNSKIITPDLAPYQAELTAGFMKLAEDIGPYLGAPARRRATSTLPQMLSGAGSGGGAPPHIQVIPIAQAQAQAAAAAAAAEEEDRHHHHHQHSSSSSVSSSSTSSLPSSQQQRVLSLSNQATL